MLTEVLLAKSNPLNWKYIFCMSSLCASDTPLSRGEH